MSPFRRGLVKWARTVHLYVTLIALALVLFFAVTGFLLNHEDWVGTDNPRTITRAGTLPAGMLGEPPDRLGVVELLRKEYGAVGEVDSFEEEADRLRVVFKRPGTRIDATIQRDDGQAEVVCETRGVVGLMLDLHRGKSTGRAWSLVIDAVCVALLVVATTGLVLWWHLKGRGRYGLAVIGLGLVLGIVIYFGFVT
jgi:hypothetical protein